ncbi:hypothetical protein [Bacillus sp. BP-3]|uniref:hypothetical protein n=1 Tax=Bacillus sp. BP-3 TaxID=3022773 RepID=UPI0023301F03|nr:hypothetical protein [Bacillus sp. BP-3]MDC2866900.1 hypothetical protein [Bacillus sp. BP-3]
MKYNRLGKSGLKISEISLGSYLTFAKNGTEKDAYKQIPKEALIEIEHVLLK